MSRSDAIRAVALIGAASLLVGAGELTSGGPAESQSAGGGGAEHGRVSLDHALKSRVSGDQHAVSRSGQRPPRSVVTKQPPKSQPLPVRDQALAGGVTNEVAPADPRDIARSLLPSYGWDSSQFGCLDELYLHESNWDYQATNPTSGAYGIPQALPGEKMAEYGADWRTNAKTQLEWGLAYIQGSYGSPCAALSFWQSHNSY
ncbi:MAG: lytic transglycosylase domain-containing protein [Nocardioidaceae bacterium]